MAFRRNCIECRVKGPHCCCTLDRVALQRMDGLGTWLRLAGRERILSEGDASGKVYVAYRGTFAASRHGGRHGQHNQRRATGAGAVPSALARAGLV